ncbi:Hpt domain-containing protein [Marinobacter sp.]|uniref:Hpt domain-containing protein n=1 Tax=Marinobacter sp. TaxID=50741 RepID=UPI00384E8E19
MGNHHDSIALDWVRGEIQDTLTQGQRALEAYVNNRDDTARLRFCLNYLHQVHGTLQMVELYGAALLTEEMEKLTQAVLDETVLNVEEAVEILMQAILQLPQYLEHLASSRDDFPLVLLPLLNDLRAARGEALLSDTSLFKPDLTPARFKPSAQASQRLQDPNVLGHIRKLRQMYQFALAGVVRETDLAAHFDYLHKVILRLIKLCHQTPRAELWRAAGGFVDSIRSGHNPVNAAVKSILRELDSELRRLIDEHVDILQQPVPEALFKHLLYYVARARDLDTPYIRDLTVRYGLDEALPSEAAMDEARDRVSGPGREAIHSVVSALNEELAKLKDQLDLFVRAEFRQNSELEELLPGLQQVANTLAVLGLGIPRRVTTEQIETVEALIQQSDPVDDGTLMDIAGALLYIEATLAGLEKEGTSERGRSEQAMEPGSRELGEASSALLRESRNSLEQVKTAVVNFIASQWNEREIEHVPGLLHSIRGGLRLIPLNRVADMLESAERYVTDVLLEGKRIPDWRQLDTLADTVTSIEYYLERKAEGIEDNEAILRIAEDSLSTLGFPVGAEPTWDAAKEDTADVGEIPEPETASDLAETADTDLVDDEILEIFVEEAEEVLATIHIYYPRLRQQYDDREALTEVRRAFHTLKGSGRMVGATSLGELAWGVENLLNRIIDQSIRPSDEIFALIDDVVERVPSLIQEFRAGEYSGDVEQLAERAEALATTRKTGSDAGEEAPAAAGAPEPESIELGAPATPEEVAEEDDLIDDEILEIFIEEAGEVLDTIRENLPVLVRQYDDRSALAEVRRAFHTLKGSGRMVGATVSAELSWSVENMLNRIIDGSVFMNDDIAQLLQDVTDVLPEMVADFENRRPVSRDVTVLEARAKALANGEISDTRSMPVDVPGALAQDPEETNASETTVDPVLIEIFESETETHLQTLQDFLRDAGDKTSVAFTDDLSRALHTLKGSAHTAGIEPIARVVTPLEKFIKDARAENRRADREVLGLIADVCEFITHGLAQIRTSPQTELPGTGDFLARLDEIASRTLGDRRPAETEALDQQDPQLISLFLNEGLDVLLDADAIIDDWAATPEQTDQFDLLVHELGKLSVSADQSGITDVAELAGLLHQVHTRARDAGGMPDESFLLTVKEAQENLINMMDQVAAGLATRPDQSLIDELVSLKDQASNAAMELYEEEFSGELEEIDQSFETDLGISQPGEAEQPEENPDAASDAAMDAELAEIFLEEAGDLIESTADTLQQWSEKPESVELLRLLQRDLHTLKGGARLADITPIGDLAHELETLFEGLTEHRLSVTDELSDLLFRCHDRLASMVDALQAGEAPRPAPDLIGEIHSYMGRASGSRPVTRVEETGETGSEELLLAETGEPPEPAEGSEEADPETVELDPELAEIFLEEAGEIINTTAEQLHQWQANPDQPELVKELQRELHTLKGGARMADISPIADIAHEMETLFERIAEGRISATAARTELALRAHDQLAALVEAIADQGQCPAAPDLVKELQEAVTDTPAETAEKVEEPRLESQPDPDQVLPDVPAERPEEAEPADTVADLSHLDPELIGIFLEEAYDLINSTGSALHAWSEDPGNRELARQLQRDVHTLKGGARMAGVAAIGDLTHVLEDLFEKVAEGEIAASPAMHELLFACHDRLAQMVEQVATGKPCPPAEELVAEVEAILHGRGPAAATTEPESAGRVESPTELEAQLAGARDEDLTGIFLDEGLEIHAAIEECLAQWRENPEELTGVTRLQQELHTLTGGARLSDLDAVADLSEAWHDNLEPLIEGSGNQHAMLGLSDQAVAGLKNMLVALEEGRKPEPAPELIAALNAVTEAGRAEAAEETPETSSGAPESVDTEVLEIFLEEAGEILDQLETIIASWQKEPANSRFNQEAQRALHTLKGGARLSQLVQLGNQAHALETRLMDLGGNEPDQTAWQAIKSDFETLTAQVAEIRRQYEAAGTVSPAPASEAPATPVTKMPEAPAAKSAPAPQAPKQTAKQKASSRQAEAARSAQETIRVSAPLLDELVNLAGETSITRGRLETQTSDFGHTLDEMAATIERLREQLRRMDIETEAQILFRAEQEHGPDYGDDFDPLEMDRYSSIQQLSRALSESSSDLADLRETLADRVRDTETLLVQQSRINTELQEGLMKTRMIPFASMVPRLRRIVRQISGELGKKVEFDVRNAEGEMDRNILERMIAPLEHMLRNALDHGIEAPADRKKSGKPETGEVTLSLTREGGDVVLRMIDDGAGIPTKVIRDKAIRQGMLREDEELSDREILQFILQPGFSTAQKVTQISGRGVGMDVVASEIKQLGGSLDIDSMLGKGTTFTVRLPFTVSVNRALMVSTGEDFYAIPLNTIEGIVRVSTYELEEYYQPDAPMYEYAGQQYRLQYLGGLLHSEHHPKLQGQALPLPVILVRGAEQPMALQVDSLMGSREIVVKSLGPQFGSVRGVSGATILGDGNVVVILDLPAMIRSDILSERQRLAQMQGSEETQRREARQTVVMVVDDSVTVRKVTSRLLERNGMEVITAKDGLDAVAQLQDHQPDIILLDIEMPRMDGFEVASFVRHDETLKHTPICMITSRTGQKHRERALAIGVNEYLGKPFQETELLETIQRLTGNT